MGGLRFVGLAVLAVVSASCGGGGGQAADPRCTSLCQYKGPADMTFGTYCNETSASLCADSCTVRIKGVNTVCQSCLLEQAYFQGSDYGGNGTQCTNNTCTVGNGSATCQYTQGNTAQETACYQMLYPLKAVDCTPHFRPVTDCSSVCATTP